MRERSAQVILDVGAGQVIAFARFPSLVDPAAVLAGTWDVAANAR